ncbi:YqaJ viral recombinase family protein [Thiomicrorhabdus xiamenensis]|uniref:YqaJ viral recombinase family protein n=2 Tax=Thiomicrorhabdus xiamenensis TaxID=2739063 RepID=A0A7D4P6G7_9GAMM|nr:YqaJ viral recombinase family protein [Thiomicrorhabdus xiamenensis]
MLATRNLSQDQWLKARLKGIGSSDASAAVGLNPYKSQLELWMEKTGRITPEQPSEVEDSPLLWGTVLEPIVAEHYAKRTQRKVRRVNAILQHSEHEWMLANLDRDIVGDEEVQILECKTAGIHSAKFWENGVPEYIQLQVQHQLAVTGQFAADVAVLIGGQKLETYRVERDDELIKQLIKLEALFWKRVEDDIPPPVDANSSSAQALRLLYPHDNNQTLNLETDEEANRRFNTLLSVREQLTILSKQEALLKHQLQETIGENSIALFEQGKITWRQSKPSTQLDTKRFKQEEPKLYEKYSKPKLGTRRFLVQTTH